MDSCFQGTDIHEFLVCLGRNAIANVTFGFSDLQTLEPDVHNLVFVEDVEPSLADLGSIVTEGGKKGWNENQEVATPFLNGSGAGKGGAPSDNGWGAEGDDIPCDDGWGMPETQENGPPDGWGWNTPKEDIPAASGWGMVQNANTRKSSMPLNNDWGMADNAPLEGGWDAKQAAASSSDYGWDSVVKNGGHKTASAHPHRKTADMTDPTDNYHASERRSGVFGPSGSNVVPLGKRKVTTMKEVCDPTDGLHFDKFKSDSPCMKTMQCVEGDQTAWENCTQFGDKGLGEETVSGNGWGLMKGEALSDNGWGVVKTTPCDDTWVTDDVAKDGATQENSAASHDKEKNAPKDTSMSGWGMGESTQQNTPTDSGWGIAEDTSLESGWGVATNQQKMSDDGWDAIEGQNARDGWHKAAYTHPSRKAINTTDLTEVHGASETRSGMFGPSGSNLVQLGKRRNIVKADVSYSMKKGKQCEEKGDQTVWATREKTTSVDDSGWESNTLDEGNINEQTGQKGSGHDEWATASELGTLAAGQTNQIPNDSLGGDDWKCAPEPEASNTNGWGSEAQVADNSQGNGWDDINSDAPSALRSMEQPQPGWGSKALDPSDTPPSTWLPRQDDMPRPRRRATHQPSNGDSWVGFASNGPKTQSRRSRLRTLMASPEYAELDELQKFANQILHNKGYQNGDKLNPEDEKLVLEKVLEYHPDKEAKLGCGVDYLMIDAHSDHQVSCFFVVRKDGSKTDFSYWKCLEGMLETKYCQVDKDEVPKEEAKDSWEKGI